MTAKEREAQEAIKRLREWLKPGDTICLVLRHESRSGMSRVIQPIIFRNGEPLWLGYNVAKATDSRYSHKHEGVVVEGCGMDMGFALVYNLSRTLFPHGFGTSAWGRYCRKCGKKHSDNSTLTCKCGAATQANYDRNGPLEFDPEGGYALKHRWL